MRSSKGSLPPKNSLKREWGSLKRKVWWEAAPRARPWRLEEGEGVPRLPRSSIVWKAWLLQSRVWALLWFLLKPLVSLVVSLVSLVVSLVCLVVSLVCLGLRPLALPVPGRGPSPPSLSYSLRFPGSPSTW